MGTKEYKLLDGRIIQAKYDRLGMCKISQENLESFVEEFNTSYRQAEILEKIKENYALMKLEERKVGKILVNDKFRIPMYECLGCGKPVMKFWDYCPRCGGNIEERKNESTD